MEDIPSNYIIQQIYSYCNRPIYKKASNVYNAECCVCNEGRSKGKKRRLFYYPKEHSLFCFNCNRHWKDIDWVKEVTNKSFLDIIRDIRSYNGEVDYTEINKPQTTEEKKLILDLPEESINLCNQKECDYYINQNNEASLVVKKALEYCTERRLFTAINRPKTLHISVKDFIHKNRLVIPFYDKGGKVEYYQTRTLNADEYPKYLCKGGDKCLFGMHNIDYDIPYLFLFEGPIDGMFVKNGLGMAGLNLTESQDNFVKRCIGMESIYVFDNDKNNKEVKDHIKRVIKSGKRVFIWPKEFKNFKDVNEICCKLQLDEFPWKYIVANTQQGIKALLNM